MGTKVNSNYEDLISFVRASGGGRATALRPVSYGTELVTNGAFDDSSALDDWTANNANLSINNQRLEVENSGSSQGTASQSITTEVGKIYKASFDVVKISGEGNPIVRLGVSNGGAEYYSIAHSSDATISFIFTPTTTTTFWTLYTGSSTSGFSAIFDNISVKEVLFDQPDGTLTLFEHPENVPRVEYDADGNRLGLLVEEARTNLVTYSEDFSNSYWGKNALSVTKKTGIVAPDGSENVYHLQEDTNNLQHQLSVTLTAGTHAFSVFAKGDGSGRYLKLYGYGLGSSSEAPVFDVDNGIVYEPPTQTHFLSASIQDVGNGWYRCSLRADTDGGSGSPTFALVDATDSHGTAGYTGDGTSGVYLYGAQVEAGSFPTSYIKSNSGSTTTRSADVASIPVADFGYNTAVGSVVAEYLPTKVDATIRAVFELVKDTNDKLYSASATIRHWFVKSGNTVQANLDLGSSTEDQSNKIAGAYKLNDFAASLDGASVNTDTSGSVPTGITDLHIGGIKDSSSSYLNGHIKSIKYYPRRLTNAQLQELTS